MFAIGRRPNVADIGLEAAGVTCGQNGGIEVDAFSRTCVPSIYAVGDVTNRVNLTPVAIREGHAFADTVFGARPTAVDHADIPTAVFSEPEIGVIGLTETQARERLGCGRHLQGRVPPHEGDAVGTGDAHPDEARRRRRQRPGGRSPHRRRRRRRDDPAPRHRGAHAARPKRISTPPWRFIRPPPRNSSPSGSHSLSIAEKRPNRSGSPSAPQAFGSGLVFRPSGRV